MADKMKNKKSFLAKNKKAQINIFVVIAILIVTALALVLFLYHRQSISITPSNPEEPDNYISQCTGKALGDAVSIMLDNEGYIGGYANFSFEYEEIPYWCYTPNNYARCTPLAPMTIEHFETEIEKEIKPKVEECFSSLKTSLEKKGYSVKMSPMHNFSVEMMPSKVSLSISRDFIAEKSGEPRKFNKFSSQINSPLYLLAVTSHEIMRQEITFCNADTLALMRGNSRLTIEKFTTGNDNKIYTIKDTLSEKEWKIAFRNCVLPTPA
ncbi:hypothetical protein J4463_03750 [Candidatus Pacearchaeota archaeon]|nr:hypothetical protein [Candidatus Pacearchaeota archaeon]